MADTLPHNRANPIDLRVHPVCYLCGRSWVPVRVTSMTRGVPRWKRMVVRCGVCGFTTSAIHDNWVIDARGWPREFEEI